MIDIDQPPVQLRLLVAQHPTGADQGGRGQVRHLPVAWHRQRPTGDHQAVHRQVAALDQRLFLHVLYRASHPGQHCRQLTDPYHRAGWPHLVVGRGGRDQGDHHRAGVVSVGRQQST